MDYEKAYKEALKRAKSFRTPDNKDVAAYIFPELAESDDERMIQYFKDLAPFDNAEELYEKYGFSHKDAIAWLEKQGEQKPWSEEDEKKLSDIIKGLVHPWDEYIPDRIEDEIKWLKNKLKSIRPQSTWMPSKEQMKALWNVYQGGKEQAELATLYNDLKKLMEK